MARISVIGLGKLGACMAACFAVKGHEVIGADLNPVTVSVINSGIAPVIESRLQEMIQSAESRISATTDVFDAVSRTDATFIIVPTPSLEDGGFSLEFVKAAAAPIARAIKGKVSYHLVVLSSTVLPGATCGELVPLLERLSEKRCGLDFGVCYGPEFIALGSVIHDLLNPDFVLIGESDPKAGCQLQDIYRGFFDNNPSISRMNIVNAELTKIALNTFVTTKITFANMLAGLCEALPGADVDVVTAALGQDRRVGTRYLRGGLGYGGPCFPRDNKALSSLAKRLDKPAHIAESTDVMNRVQVDRVVKMVKGIIPYGSNLAVIGLAYKENTPVVEESQPLQIALDLAKSGYRVTAFDPLANSNADTVAAGTIRIAENIDVCLAGADAVVYARSDDAYAERVLASHSEGRHPVIIDCWRVLKDHAMNIEDGKYFGVGIASNLINSRRR